MKRSLLALAVAAAASFLAAPASAEHCGDDTLQPPCETCVEYFTDRRLVCVPLDPHLIGG